MIRDAAADLRVTPIPVFVFGTLKEGFPNFGSNAGRRLPGMFRTRLKMPLFLVGERCSPWLLNLPGIRHHVFGQIFEVDRPALEAMDILERVHESDGYQEFRCKLAAGLEMIRFARAPASC